MPASFLRNGIKMKRIDLEKVDSTNKYLKKIDIDDSVIVFCKEQTNGYGQYQRTWYSKKDCSLAFSYKYNSNSLPIIKEDFVYKIASKFSKMIDSYFNIKTSIKLPNDIYLNGKKLCGVLVETKISNGQLEKVIIGIGININNEDFNEEIKDVATSIYLNTKQKYDIDEFKNYLYNNFENAIIKE